MTAIFYTILEKENDTGEIDHIPMLKTFVVFNVEQIDGLLTDGRYRCPTSDV